ncbi:MAG: hypothetical protein ACJ798_15635 [Phenylobacterium sp.]
MKSSLLVSFIAAALLACSQAVAADFAAYDGKDAVREGEGGTKVVTDGIEFWTSGAPPHRYRILGVLTDQRGTGLLSGSATGNSVAKHIRSLGGDGAIVLGRDEHVRGAVISNGMVGILRRATTQLLVVKYEDGPPTAAPQ